MCGIVVAGRFKEYASPSPLVEYQYNIQRERGSDGFGFVSVAKGGKLAVRRFAKEGKAINALRSAAGHLIAFHHRYPTSTANTAATAHPITVRRSGLTFHVIHNGVIQNDDELFSLHTKEGLKYSTLHSWKEGDAKKYAFNDSECLAHELAAAYLDPAHAVRAKGSAAWVMVVEAPHKNPRILFGRNSQNPLRLYSKDGCVVIASQGAGEMVKEDAAFELDIRSGEVSEVTPIRVPVNFVPAFSYGFGSHRPYASAHSPNIGRGPDAWPDAWPDAAAASPSPSASESADDFYKLTADGRALIAGEDIRDLSIEDLAEELALLPAPETDAPVYDQVREAVCDELRVRGVEDIGALVEAAASGSFDDETETTVDGFVPRLTACPS